MLSENLTCFEPKDGLTQQPVVTRTKLPSRHSRHAGVLIVSSKRSKS